MNVKIKNLPSVLSLYFCAVKNQTVSNTGISADSTDSAPSCLLRYRSQTQHFSLPERFTFPFYYEPHPLSELAAAELKELLTAEMKIGKMFGVLVVQDQQGELGYLTAFSGRSNNEYPAHPFVPQVYDAPENDAWYRAEEAKVNALNHTIRLLESDPELLSLKTQLKDVIIGGEAEKKRLKQRQKEQKQVRDVERKTALSQGKTSEELAQIEEQLKKNSMQENLVLRDFSRDLNGLIQTIETQIQEKELKIQSLKDERKALSRFLQRYIFDNFCFLNARGDKKSIWDVFELSDDLKPPSGAGECAAPKLLQYAYQNKLKPIALAEFWWGPSHSSEIRKHGIYYPACRGKCEPILSHMLDGLEIDPNPLDQYLSDGKEPVVIYEDEFLAVINKPHDFLSVPGKTSSDSVYERMQKRFPDASGPLIVHRLDMSTSGLMLIAKTKAAHHQLQRQFLKKTVQKRYVALIEGIPADEEGMIRLPLRVDLDDRPRQLVCFEHGKPAVTRWKIVGQTGALTRIHFWPITGRTHQLRVHAAHPDGLNAPIAGDDLYGNRNERLYLHAESIRFIHPGTGEYVSFEVKAEF